MVCTETRIIIIQSEIVCRKSLLRQMGSMRVILRRYLKIKTERLNLLSSKLPKPFQKTNH